MEFEKEERQMILNTKFNIGDKVFCACERGNKIILEGPFTIGSVRKSVTDSPGREGETIFDNYKPRKSEEESYMCVETGIGSGQLFYAENLFSTCEEAVEEFKKLNLAFLQYL